MSIKDDFCGKNDYLNICHRNGIDGTEKWIKSKKKIDAGYLFLFINRLILNLHFRITFYDIR